MFSISSVSSVGRLRCLVHTLRSNVGFNQSSLDSLAPCIASCNLYYEDVTILINPPPETTRLSKVHRYQTSLGQAGQSQMHKISDNHYCEVMSRMQAQYAWCASKLAHYKASQEHKQHLECSFDSLGAGE